MLGKHRAYRHREGPSHTVDCQAGGVHRIDMLAPAIHQYHVVPCLRHVGAGEAANGTGADDREPQRPGGWTRTHAEIVVLGWNRSRLLGEWALAYRYSMNSLRCSGLVRSRTARTATAPPQ